MDETDSPTSHDCHVSNKSSSASTSASDASAHSFAMSRAADFRTPLHGFVRDTIGYGARTSWDWMRSCNASLSSKSRTSSLDSVAVHPHRRMTNVTSCVSASAGSPWYSTIQFSEASSIEPSSTAWKSSLSPCSRRSASLATARGALELGPSSSDSGTDDSDESESTSDTSSVLRRFEV